ncbi:MAG: hypothetical protein JJU10_04130 [Idiomarina sp.]|nr:hypothetical protein [Idiomarina sp.]
MTELALAISLLGLLLLWAIPHFHQHLHAWSEVQQQAQLVIHQAELRERHGIEPLMEDELTERYGFERADDLEFKLSRGQDYAFADAMGPVWRAMQTGQAASMRLDTLHSLVLQREDEAPWFGYRHLTDDWSPRRISDLTSRPRALTLTHQLDRFGFSFIQQWVGVLPFAREFAPSQLQLGYVTAEPIPEAAQCRDSACSR